MILSDRDIAEEMVKGRIKIDPSLDTFRYQPASVDLSLGEGMLTVYKFGLQYLDPLNLPEDLFKEKLKYMDDSVYHLKPNECALATTAEKITLPDDIVGHIEGKSSLGRLFLMVHSTAGFIDPGWSGNITLELKNLSGLNAINLTPGMLIAQIAFHRLSSPAKRPYGTEGLKSHYQNQVGVTKSRYEG